MSPVQLLASRIRGEFREMPGLRLTFPQACRFWQLEAETCQAVLDLLLSEQFLLQTADGAFIGHQMARPARRVPLKAAAELPNRRLLLRSA
jgi:hypothetical protein